MSKKIEKVTDEILRGAREIEDFMGRSYIDLVDLRRDFEFPMKKDSVPILSMADFKEWAAKYNVSNIDPHNITTAMLFRHEQLTMIEQTESRELVGEDLYLFVGQGPDTIIRWAKEENSPIKRKPDRKYFADAKELKRWMFENGITRGDYRPPQRLRPWEVAMLNRGLGR